MSEIFHIHGYTIEIYVHNKYKGSYVVDAPDRKDFGYSGRKTEILSKDIVLSNKKRIKAGIKIMSECSPICGRTKRPLIKYAKTTEGEKEN